MITFTGTFVGPNDDGVPNLTDIAVGLGRQPRFGGHTNTWWPVILHSFLCYRIAQHKVRGPYAPLYALFHDAHECVTADVPSTWKNDETRLQQERLDRRIFTSFGIPFPTLEQASLMKAIDSQALAAEGAIVGPPGIASYTEKPNINHKSWVRGILGIYPGPQFTDGPKAPAVVDYMRLVRQNLQWLREELADA